MENIDRNYQEGIGRRKRASARVRIYIDDDSTGDFIVNDKDVNNYLPPFELF